MCPGPIGKGCPFSRNDCSFHEEGDGLITTVGQAAFPLQTVVKTVEQLIARGHDDEEATGPSAADIARRAAESVNEDQRRRS
jgi:hypothetical protein